MSNYKASEIFTQQEAEFVKWLLQEFNGKIVSITDMEKDNGEIHEVT